MIITGLENLTKTRSRISIDGEFAFVLYKGELRRFHLQVGEELSERDYETITKEILPKRAKLRAMNLLLKKDYTTAKLREKLREGGYSEEIVQEALDYVASYHYTDDLRFAVDFIRCHQQDRSRLRMEQDLRAKGISEDVMEQAFYEWEQAGGVQDVGEMIQKLLRKRGFDSKTATVSEQNREYAFLMRKGFSSDDIRKAIFHSDT